ncbi:hypothetical protein KC367_g5475 [Hortaea werneckii]|uniref:Uncharacterized protein n=1 Tax=Hortaea werneckii EXF-2000 TaxID=1157616 RepID=A0A1Z5SPF4_HORWE|nr:hypothetical protein KC358_g16159 [Hortaea werneckii]OTA22704.1 hypothetical protein BTJ68_13818 [Hortaea werneckii EXF-2000]KAI6801350.1 hypothetical protein KC350_g15665 [Hortaea werneckii]KAI6839530.1 hypothetical protein KC342_g3398 [Hortaea werneckii]KAI6902323.1 hypothetical protein KC348_g16138 [Hortaea werneckii]
MADALKNTASGATNTVQQGAQGVTDTAKQGAQGAQNAASGTDKWNAMTEDQKKQTFDQLPDEQKKGKSYTEWIKEGYQHQYENWMPWIEDMYLRWFTNDNKASYATKDTLDKTKVTGIEPVDKLQGDLNNTVGNQFGQGGAFQGVGDAVSKEGVNRAERGGKDDSGSYTGAVGDSAKSAGSGIYNTAAGAGSYVTGMFGGGKKEGQGESK